MEDEIFRVTPDGYIEAFGIRVVVFRIETRASIRATILDLLGDGGKIVLGLIGEKIGSNSANFGLKKGLFKGLEKETFEFLRNIYLKSGWGKRECKLEDNKIVVRIFTSFEADAHMIAFGKSEEPSCFFVRGYLRGFFSTLLGKDVQVEEVKCRARGDEYCEFHISVREEE